MAMIHEGILQNVYFEVSVWCPDGAVTLKFKDGTTYRIEGMFKILNNEGEEVTFKIGRCYSLHRQHLPAEPDYFELIESEGCPNLQMD